MKPIKGVCLTCNGLRIVSFPEDGTTAEGSPITVYHKTTCSVCNGTGFTYMTKSEILHVAALLIEEWEVANLGIGPEHRRYMQAQLQSLAKVIDG